MESEQGAPAGLAGHRSLCEESGLACHIPYVFVSIKPGDASSECVRDRVVLI